MNRRFLVHTNSPRITLIVKGDIDEDGLYLSLQSLKEFVRPTRILDDETGAEVWTKDGGFNNPRKK